MAYPSPPPPQPPWSPAPPPRNYRPLIIGLAVGLPALVLLVVVAVVASGGGTDADDPNDVAERFLDAIERGDVDAAEAELCESGASLLPATVEEIVAGEPDVSLTEPLEDPAPELAGGGVLGGLEGTTSEGPADGQIYVAQPDLEEDSPYCVNQYIFLSDPLD